MTDATHAARIPATIVTGFLGAGKTTLLRHFLAHAGGRRIAIIVNEFGSLGIDGELLRSCGMEGCDEDQIIELANGCLCCTVADEFIPAMQRLLDRDQPPDHIVIETSGLALPKPLLKAFGWPAIRSRITVDGVVTVLDGPAVAAGRFADDPELVARQREADPTLDHDNPLAEVYEDQLNAADLVLVNKIDQLAPDALATIISRINQTLPRAVKVLAVEAGRIDPSVALGIAAAAEDDLAARPSHHDQDEDHEHNDFESFVVSLPECRSFDALFDRMRNLAAQHDILRMKGFVAVAGKTMRGVVHGVGMRMRGEFDRPWRISEARAGRLVVIGRAGLDRASIQDALQDAPGG